MEEEKKENQILETIRTILQKRDLNATEKNILISMLIWNGEPKTPSCTTSDRVYKDKDGKDVQLKLIYRHITIRGLENITGLSHRTVINSLKSLRSKQYIKEFGKPKSVAYAFPLNLEEWSYERRKCPEKTNELIRIMAKYYGILTENKTQIEEQPLTRKEKIGQALTEQSPDPLKSLFRGEGTYYICGDIKEQHRVARFIKDHLRLEGKSVGTNTIYQNSKLKTRKVETWREKTDVVIVEVIPGDRGENEQLWDILFDRIRKKKCTIVCGGTEESGTDRRTPEQKENQKRLNKYQKSAVTITAKEIIQILEQVDARKKRQ